MNAIGMMVTVMMVSMLRRIWRMERPSITPMSLKTCLFIVPFSPFTDDGEEYLLQGRLFFHILHLGGREQLFQVRERAVGDNFPFMQNGNPIGELFRLIQILRGQKYRR